jgi:hypothetical protein
MSNKTLYRSLVISAGLGFLFTLALYARLAENPLSSRLGFAAFVAVLPALCTFLFFRLTRLFVSWQRAATAYLVLFLLILITFIGRLLTVSI